MSYLISADRLSLAKQESYRAGADRMAKERLAKKLAIPLASAMDPVNPAVICRDADYPTDFVPAATRAGLVGWLSMPLAAVAGVYSLFADNVPAALTPIVPNNQAWTFYGVQIFLNDLAVESVTQITFGVGTAANRRAQFDLETLYGGLTGVAYFSQPVYYDPQETATVNLRARVATAVGCRLALLTFIAEPIQQTVI